MTEGSEGIEVDITQLTPGHEKPGNFNKLMKLITESAIQQPAVEGLQNLAEIPPNQQVVFAVSHLSDVDVPAAASALSLYRPIDVVILRTGAIDLKQIPFIKLAGKHHFHTIDNTFNLKTQTPHTRFNADNFQEMKEAMSKGRDIVIAVHKPTRDGKLSGNPGIGSIYLAQMADALIVPVALDIHSEKPIGMAYDLIGTLRRIIKRVRPKATLSIGKPMALPKIPQEDLDDVSKLLTNQRKGLRINKERYIKAIATYKKLKEQSGVVIKAIAAMLPEKKRGVWQSDEPVA